MRKSLSMLRSLVGISVHICVCGGSSGGEGGRICTGAASVGGNVVVLGIVAEDLRWTNGFVGVRGSKIHVC